MMNIPDSGLADPLFGSGGASGVTEPSFLPHSTIYNWSSGHFSKPLLTANDDNEDIIARRKGRERIALDNIVNCQHSSITKLHNQVSSWHTKFETRMQAILLEPFSPIVCAADENERIRIWDYKESKMLNEFDNHDYPNKGVSKLCHLNDLDDGLLLVASGDGNVRIWKDYTLKDNQKLLTAFCAVQIQRPDVGSVNVVVDWQQQSGYLSASEAQAGQVVAGFTDGSIRLFDIRAPKMLNIATQQHNQRVMGIGFQPGLDPLKIVSASQAGDIQFHDVRLQKNAYLTIDAHRGSLTALAVHRNAPIIASGSAKQLIKVFNLNGEQLGSIRYYPTFMARQIGAVCCLTFHPFQVLLAAGASDARGSSLVMKDLMEDE